MQKIEALIRPFRLDSVAQLMGQLEVGGVTVSQAQGVGRQLGRTEVYRGVEYAVDFLPKIRLELVVSDERVDTVVSSIAECCRTGRVGDGKIFIQSVSQGVRISSGQVGDATLA